LAVYTAKQSGEHSLLGSDDSIAAGTPFKEIAIEVDQIATDGINRHEKIESTRAPTDSPRSAPELPRK
jgi:hypothetical protein